MSNKSESDTSASSKQTEVVFIIYLFEEWETNYLTKH